MVSSTEKVQNIFLNVQKANNLAFSLTVGKQRKGKLLVVGFFVNEKKEKPKECQNFLISNKENAVSLISEEKKVYVCLGKKRQFNKKKITVVAKLFVGFKKYSLDFDLSTFITEQVPESVVLEVFAKVWCYFFHKPLTYKTKKVTDKLAKPKEEKQVSFHLLSSSEHSRVILEKVKSIFNGVNTCRYLQDMPPNFLHSVEFAKLIKFAFSQVNSVDCQILGADEIKREGMNLLLAVNAGSFIEPRVVVLKYFGNPQEKTKVSVVLGKGITFDTGGYSLKPSEHQIGMKFDMSGAAIAVSALWAISQLKLKVNVIVVVCLTDNALGAKSTFVESVITSGGKSVEITNTDAEGRLILADGLSYALKHFQPTGVIELSTLTGAISVTLGTWMTGIFVNSCGEKLYQNFATATKQTAEPIWRLPVTSENLEAMKSDVADLVNASKSYKGASSNAAAFLFQFIPKTPFIHLDIAGTATKPENQRGTGVMVQSLVQYFENFQDLPKKENGFFTKNSLKSK